MKRMYSTSSVRYLGHRQSSRVLLSLFSTKTLTPPPSSSVDSLYKRLAAIEDPKASIAPVLEKWFEEARPAIKQELQSLVQLMKNYKRFKHALEISQWMSDRRHFKLSPTDVAVRLVLISRVRGPEHAEIFFNSISTNLKSFRVYGALLHIYVQEKSVAKAESIMQKMREMGFATTSFPYNMMINLYSGIGEHSKMHVLIQEMDSVGIPLDMFTLKNQISAYALASDILGVEKVLNDMEEDPFCVVDWKVYSIAASGYLKVGLIDKALAMLKKMEGTMPLLKNSAFKRLISLYADTGLKNEVYRVWNLYMPLNNKVHNQSYSEMITALAKLDDVDGAEKIFQEWETRRTSYDFRVLNRLLVAYCWKGLFDKAELAISKAIIEGRKPHATTWNILALGYVENKQMDEAVEMLKKALLVGRQGWRPNSAALDACLEYLEGEGNVEVMEEIVILLNNSDALTKDIYHRLLRTCVTAGRSISGVLVQMKMNGFTADEETQRIVEVRPSL